MIFFIWNKGIPKDIIENIEQHTYSEEEMLAIYQHFSKKDTTKSTGLNRVFYILGFGVLFIGILTFMTTSKYRFIPFLILILLCIGILWFVKWLYVQKEMRQLKAAVEKGYPELKEKFIK